MFTPITKIIKDAKKGKMFILVDDENRENEGDLVIPHTLKLTNLKNIKNNDIVNIEIDIIAKYIKGLKK